MSVLVEKLKSFEYYKNKLPMYLQSSDGFISHFEIWYDLLIGQNNNGVVNVCDTILNLLNIFDKDFLTNLIKLENTEVSDEHPYGTKSDILDKLALFFGLTREFSCVYTETQQEFTKEISLDNEELLLLIKCQVLRGSYDGTYEQYKSFYKDIGLEMLLLTKDNYASTVDLLLAKIEGAQPGEKGYYSENIEIMFKSNLLRVQSLGITYNCSIVDLTTFLIWDNSNKVWDKETWGI